MRGNHPGFWKTFSSSLQRVWLIASPLIVNIKNMNVMKNKFSAIKLLAALFLAMTICAGFTPPDHHHEKGAHLPCYICFGSGQCQSCHGKGWLNCSNCGGSGQFASYYDVETRKEMPATRCNRCEGTGKDPNGCFVCLSSGKCYKCDGKGQTPN
jgi:hypothetical protein